MLLNEGVENTSSRHAAVEELMKMLLELHTFNESIFNSKFLEIANRHKSGNKAPSGYVEHFLKTCKAYPKKTN